MRYDALPAGHRIGGRYVVQRVAGRGRSAVVYKALDLQTRTVVAIKLLDPLLAQDPVDVQRFVREAEIIRAVDHPNIVKVYGVEEDGASRFIVMEYFDGSDGKSLVRSHGGMPVSELLPVARALAGALQACHLRQVLHRDLKPQNLLIDARGGVKLVDFGVSRMNNLSDLTRTGAVLGTPEYMAPELFRTTMADPRSDIYSLGVVLYELLAGKPPHHASSLATIMTRHLRDEIEPFSSRRPDVPAWLQSVILKCLRIDPARRYQSCDELLADLAAGERACAVYEEKQDRPICVGCRGSMIPGLVFCHHCGVFTHETYEPGSHSIVIAQCDAPSNVLKRLRRMFPDAPARVVKRRLETLPRVLFGGVSEQTAMNLVSQLAGLPCELRVTPHVLSQLPMPMRALVIACLPLIPLFFAPGLSMPMRFAFVLAAEGVVFLLYLDRRSPIVPLRAGSRTAAATADEAARRCAAQLTRLTDPNLKNILANIVAAFLRVRKGSRRSTTFFDPAPLERVVDAALETAPAVERYAEHLSGTGLQEIGGRLEAVELKIKQRPEARTMTELVDLKTKLLRERADYLAIQDLHARLYLSLFRLHSVLRRIDDALAMSPRENDFDSELQALEQELASPDPIPAVKAAV